MGYKNERITNKQIKIPQTRKCEKTRSRWKSARISVKRTRRVLPTRKSFGKKQEKTMDDQVEKFL